MEGGELVVVFFPAQISN